MIVTQHFTIESREIIRALEHFLISDDAIARHKPFKITKVKCAGMELVNLDVDCEPILPPEPWEWGNDTPVWLKPRRTIYFIYRRNNGDTVYLNDKRGRLRQWRSADTVKKALARLLKVNKPKENHEDNHTK